MTTSLVINNVTTLDRDGEVAIITIDAPPVNALSHRVRSGICQALEHLLSSADRPRAVVLTCAGRTFFAGADITELGQPVQEPGFPTMLEAVESAPFPIIAAIHGTALGGGLELAMACHYRVATQDARVGLPEVKLGILPGAGGTQRLPRLVGVEKALEMMTSGNHVPAAMAQADGLLDLVGDATPRMLGLQFARENRPENAPLTRTRDRDERLASVRANRSVIEAFRAANARKFRGQDAPERIIRCVEAALDLPFEEGLAVERRLFEELVSGPQSAALRHVFFAERHAQRPEALKGAEPLPVERVGVIGAGTMGRGIAMALASAGLTVTISDAVPGAAAKALETMAKALRGSASRGRFTMEEAEARIARITPCDDLSGQVDSDLVIEAVFEDMAVKTTLFRELDRILPPAAIIASNTSYLDINQIAAATARPRQVLGMHFFSPANIMRLVEVVQGAATAPEVLATAFSLARRMGKVAVLSGVCHGFIGNRMLEQRQDEAMRLILEGARPQDVDRVAVAFGFPMGPFAMHDLAGLDLGWSAETSRGETIRDLLCEAGRRGQKTGAGFFDYGADRKPVVSPLVEDMIRDFGTRNGHVPRVVEDQEIADRLILPMINEGARILAEGIAARASDIDLVWINGYGWPLVTGGPMFWAEQNGLAKIVTRLEALENVHGERFAPAQYLRKCAARGGWLPA
ncbi:3-hydroxyacyl-CoA dehydrogenase NAD-binding domain-containing protein [Microvirga pakistanensis]|uniref:3-hydroxyacyl-CoA dehydrogenase NAD-binding domain-containing protein n=1 Tax=Microvirga pakistanensis TaxID=1682650 RepID=UPI001069E56C|nr:3-hydroxyacyl-CoA dehydrogenase NAD-binding domain-containing protein [Microvirga pakistanensis]